MAKKTSISNIKIAIVLLVISFYSMPLHAQIDMEDAKTIVVGAFKIFDKISYDIKVRKNEKKLKQWRDEGRIDADCWHINEYGNLTEDKTDCWIDGYNYGEMWCSTCKEFERRHELDRQKREQEEIAKQRAQQKKNEEEELLKQQYVDLGLPSGTLWKKWNEDNLYEYQDAVKQFGNQIPTRKQWEELMNNCQWSLTNNGYRVVGPNGNSIDLVEEGFIMCDQTEKLSVGALGIYTSSTSSDEEEFYWSLMISNDKRFGDDISDCWKKSVRLVR